MDYFRDPAHSCRLKQGTDVAVATGKTGVYLPLGSTFDTCDENLNHMAKRKLPLLVHILA